MILPAIEKIGEAVIMNLRRIGVGLILVLATGCKEDDTKKIPFPDGKPAKPAAETAEPSPPPPALPPNHPPIDKPPPMASEQADPATLKPSPTAGMSTATFKGYAMDVPSDWKLQPAANPMRIAEFELPKVGDDREAPSLIVFFFGVGGGGGVDANIDRWRGQFDDGGKSNPGTTETLSAGSTKITLLDKSGTFKLQPRMMSPEFTPMPGWRMLAAVAEIQGGPLFFRTTGPESSVAAQKDALTKALKTLRNTDPGDFPHPKDASPGDDHE